MNEQLQGALSELIGKVNSGADTAIDFLGAELPDVIQQLLLWYGIYNFILFIIGLVIFVAGYYLALVKYRAAIQKELSGGGEPLWALILFAPAISFTMLNLTWLKIWIAPKIWLIEYAASIAK